MIRLRHWLDVLILPPLCLILAVKDTLHPPDTWWDDPDDQLTGYENQPPWR